MKSTRAPSGKRRSPTRSGTRRSHSGCAATAFRVSCSGTCAVYTIEGGCPCSRRRPSGTAFASVTAPMPQIASVSCFITLAAGSRYETPDSKGIAHFAEHMFFKGTERRPTARTISTEIDAIGGEFNAFTGKELTGYYVKAAGRTRDVALDVLPDILLQSRFDPAEIQKEKGVILEEMNVYLDTPQRYVGNVYDRLLYGDQPLGWDILGTNETIEAATHETLHAYLDAWYRPSGSSSGSGRIGEGLPERLEEPSAASSDDTGSARRELPPDTSPARLHTKSSEQAHLGLRRPRLPVGHPNWYALQLLAVVLGGGMSSRLFTEVREKRGLRSASTRGTTTYTDAGSFYTAAGVEDNRDQVEQGDHDEIIGERRKIAARVHAVGPSSRKRAATRRAGSSSGSGGNRRTIQYGLRREILEDEMEEADDILRQLDAGADEGVQRVARDLFEGKRLYLALVGPYQDPERFEQLLPLRERARGPPANRRAGRRVPRHARRAAGLPRRAGRGAGSRPRRPASGEAVRPAPRSSRSLPAQSSRASSRPRAVATSGTSSAARCRRRWARTGSRPSGTSAPGSEPLGPSASVAEVIVGDWLKELLGLPPDASFAITTGMSDGPRHRARRGTPRRARSAGLGRPRARAGRLRRPITRRRGSAPARDDRPCPPAARDRRRADRRRAGRRRGPHAPGRAAQPPSLRATGRPSSARRPARSTRARSTRFVGDRRDRARDGRVAPCRRRLRPVGGGEPDAARICVDGCADADSWATDGHKWLNVPYDCGLAFCAQARRRTGRR